MIVRQCLLNRFQQIVRFSRLKSTIRRTNPLGIQMLSSKLHEQLFSSVGEPIYSDKNIEKSKQHLQQFDLGLKDSEILDNIEFDLPSLESQNLNEHFEIIARKQSKPYIDLIYQLIKSNNIPSQPTKWKYEKGWTKFVLNKNYFY